MEFPLTVRKWTRRRIDSFTTEAKQTSQLFDRCYKDLCGNQQVSGEPSNLLPSSSLSDLVLLIEGFEFEKFRLSSVHPISCQVDDDIGCTEEERNFWSLLTSVSLRQLRSHTSMTITIVPSQLLGQQVK